MVKSSFCRFGTNRPLGSDTVAVTLISSTPLLKRNESGVGGCCAGGGCWPCTETTIVPSAATMSFFMGLFRLSHGAIAPVDVRHDPVVGPEAHAVTADIGRVWNRHHEGRLGAGRERVERRARAGDERAVAIEEKHHGREPVDARAAGRI